MKYYITSYSGTQYEYDYDNQRMMLGEKFFRSFKSALLELVYIYYDSPSLLRGFEIWKLERNKSSRVFEIDMIGYPHLFNILAFLISYQKLTYDQIDMLVSKLGKWILYYLTDIKDLKNYMMKKWG